MKTARTWTPIRYKNKKSCVKKESCKEEKKCENENWKTAKEKWLAIMFKKKNHVETMTSSSCSKTVKKGCYISKSLVTIKLGWIGFLLLLSREVIFASQKMLVENRDLHVLSFSCVHMYQPFLSWSYNYSSSSSSVSCITYQCRNHSFSLIIRSIV